MNQSDTTFKVYDALNVLKTFYENGVFIKRSFENKQLFDFEGLKGRLLSSSYAPLPGEKNYEIIMTELKKLFDKYEVDGKVPFEYVTVVYVGTV